jgi:hypothetical protein
MRREIHTEFLWRIQVTLGRLRRWEDNMKMDLWERGCEDRSWIELSQDQMHNTGLLEMN